VLFIRNGDQEVFTTAEGLCPDKWEDLLDMATRKLALLFPVRRLFDLDGNEVTTLRCVCA
jgi:hypothetical protein